MARERAGFNPDSWRVAAFLGPHLYQGADAVIEADTLSVKPWVPGFREWSKQRWEQAPFAAGLKP